MGWPDLTRHQSSSFGESHLFHKLLMLFSKLLQLLIYDAEFVSNLRKFLVFLLPEFLKFCIFPAVEIVQLDL